MRVILKENIANLGDIGDQVTVKAGYGRNFLLPQEKAVVATADNIAEVEAHRAELEKLAAEAKAAAQTRSDKLASIAVSMEVEASEEGKLFGSIGPRDIAEKVTEAGAELAKSEVLMPEGPIRMVGEYDIAVKLHAEVQTTIKVTVLAHKAADA